MKLNDRIGRRLRLRDLNIFLVVVKERSMSRAAIQLAISQPVVSKVIADMEYELGAPLLDRGRRGVEPTLYGRALIKRSIAAFDELRQGVTDIESLLDPTTGEARIGCTETLATGIVPTVIDRLTREHPRVSLHVVEGTRAALQGDLRERNIDLLIGRALTPVSDEDLESEVLFDERHFVVAGSQNRWARRRKIRLVELMNETWIFPPPGTIPGLLISEAFRTAGLETPRATVSSLSIPVNVYLLDAGRYLSVLPESTIRFSAKQLPLKVLPVDLPAKSMPVVIVTMKNRTLSPVARLFVDCARAITRPLASRK
jgi:DNA-binding transcriptional LysR family regulator